MEQVVKKPLTDKEKKLHTQDKLHKYRIDGKGDLRNPLDHKIIDGWNQNLGLPEDKLRKQINLPQIGAG